MSYEYDYGRYEEMLLKHLESMWRDPDYLQIGENISDTPEIKIIFDGYADLETEDEYIEGGDKNLESYAIFIHKDSGQEGFQFPEHELTPWALIHRPKEEVCIYAWYNVEEDEWDIMMLENTSEHEMSDEQVMEILEILDKRYSGEQD